MLVILTRGIDLSVAAILALSGMVAAHRWRIAHPGLPVPLILVHRALGIGLVLGLINGALIAFLGIPPIVITLGTLSDLSRDHLRRVGRRLDQRPRDGRRLPSPSRSTRFLGLPSSSGSRRWCVVDRRVAALPRPAAGRELYAVGGNPVAARYCRHRRSQRRSSAVYSLSGLIAGLCGYCGSRATGSPTPRSRSASS